MKKWTRFAARSADGTHGSSDSVQSMSGDEGHVFSHGHEHADPLMGLTPRQRRAAYKSAHHECRPEALPPYAPRHERAG